MEPQTRSTSTEAQIVELEPNPSANLLDAILSSASRYLTLESKSPNPSAVKTLPPLPWTELVTQWACGHQQVKSPLAKLRFKLAQDIGRIDAILADQVNTILHHPDFQDLESQWRGLEILCRRSAELKREAEADTGIVGAEIRILTVSKRELFKDFDKAIEFDQNSLFKKVYEAEFGTSGGTPYGILLANFEFSNHPDDIDLLEKLSGVGAAAFCPVITSASASMLGVDNLNKLDQPYDIDQVFQNTRFRKWLSLRNHTDAQFLGVTLPRILMRLPYEDDGQNRNGFRFREDVEGKNQEKYLWGPASWAFACVVLRAFMQSGWFADIRGMERGVDGGGVVSEFPIHSFGTDKSQAAQKTSVEVAISDKLENALSQAGFIPLSNCKDTPFSVFFSNPSVHAANTYDDQVATMNARISAMLQYVLCCSRIAHFLKIEARKKIGSSQSAREIESHLNNWITRYVTPDSQAPASLKAQYPLQSGNVVVEELPGKPGEYRIVIHLLPHYQLDSLSSTMTLTARHVTGPGAR